MRKITTESGIENQFQHLVNKVCELIRERDSLSKDEMELKHEKLIDEIRKVENRFLGYKTYPDE